jgi:hypothetical protein
MGFDLLNHGIRQVLFEHGTQQILADLDIDILNQLSLQAFMARASEPFHEQVQADRYRQCQTQLGRK